MAIYRRGRVYWYSFVFQGQRIQESTEQGNPQVARQMEAAHKTALAKGEAGIFERGPAPSLKEFAQRFIDMIQVRCAAKPKAVEFYGQQLARLLEFVPLANARLSAIDESLVEAFVQHRSRQVAPASVNRALATLSRLLHLAQEWREIDRVPRIRLLPGEHNREFVLSREQETAYLEVAPRPLRDLAALILDTGLRVGEALSLEWRDVHLEPANGTSRGYIHIGEGKSRFARRNVPLTERARVTLAQRTSQCCSSRCVFAEAAKRPMRVSSLDHAHKKLREALRLPTAFVLHLLRYSYGSRLGEAGADAFTIIRPVGHSSVRVSQRYVHPTPEALERAVHSLEIWGGSACQRIEDDSCPLQFPLPCFRRGV